MASDALRRQLEMARFERAMEVSESLAEHRALLTTTELARLNAVLTRKDSEKTDPWRQGPVTITLPSGQQETLQLLADPRVTARENLHRATEIAESGSPVAWYPRGETEIPATPQTGSESIAKAPTKMHSPLHAVYAAVHIYSSLVLSHVFQDANRRTAALAAHYFLKRYGAPISGLAIHELGLGDLRTEGQIDALRETVVQMTKFALKRSQK